MCVTTINNRNFKKLVFSYICFSVHKRIRKPSKRLIEWTEEYDQIFSTRKKNKKPLQLIGKVKMIQCKICSNFLHDTMALSIQHHFLKPCYFGLAMNWHNLFFSGHSAHYYPRVGTPGISQGHAWPPILELASWNTDTASRGNCCNDALWTTNSQHWKHVPSRCTCAFHRYAYTSPWSWSFAVRSPRQRHR